MRLLWATSELSGVTPEERQALPGLCHCDVEAVAGAAAAIEAARSGSFDVVVAEFPMAEWAPEEWLEDRDLDLPPEWIGQPFVAYSWNASPR